MNPAQSHSLFNLSLLQPSSPPTPIPGPPQPNAQISTPHSTPWHICGPSPPLKGPFLLPQPPPPRPGIVHCHLHLNPKSSPIPNSMLWQSTPPNHNTPSLAAPSSVQSILLLNRSQFPNTPLHPCLPDHSQPQPRSFPQHCQPPGPPLPHP